MTTRIAPPKKKSKPRPPRGVRRFGYGVAIAVNAVGLVVVNNLPDWTILRFLTDDFATILPIINVSFAASIAVNAAYLANDGASFKSSGQLVLNAISLVAIVRTLQVFPFDFTDYSFDWGLMARVALVIGIVGIVVGSLVEIRKLSRGGAGRSPGGR